MANQAGAHWLLSKKVLMTLPSLPVMNKSRCLLPGAQSGVTSCPGAAAALFGLMANHADCHRLLSKYVLITRPSLPVMKRSRWFGSLQRAATVWPGTAAPLAGLTANQAGAHVFVSKNVLTT